MSTENENVPALKVKYITKCKSNLLIDEEVRNETDSELPHIQDLCSSDKKRISLLIEHLTKCTREVRSAKTKLAVKETEKEALCMQQKMYVEQIEKDKQQLETQLEIANAEKDKLKVNMSQALERLMRQLAEQEKQFVDLKETIKDLLREKTSLYVALARKKAKMDAFEAKVHKLQKYIRTHTKENCNKIFTQPKMYDKSCQTFEDNYTLHINQSTQNTRQFLNGVKSKNTHTKITDDLEKSLAENTVIEELFFKNFTTTVDGDFQCIPKSLEIEALTKFSTPLFFI